MHDIFVLLERTVSFRSTAAKVRYLNETRKFVKSMRLSISIMLCIRGLVLTCLSNLTKLPPILLSDRRLLFHRCFRGQFSVRHLLSDIFHFRQIDFILQSFDNQFHKLDGCNAVGCSIHFKHLHDFLISSLQEQGSFRLLFVFHAFNLILDFLSRARKKILVKESA